MAFTKYHLKVLLRVVSYFLGIFELLKDGIIPYTYFVSSSPITKTQTRDIKFTTGLFE